MGEVGGGEGVIFDEGWSSSVVGVRVIVAGGEGIRCWVSGFFPRTIVGYGF